MRRVILILTAAAVVGLVGQANADGYLNATLAQGSGTVHFVSGSGHGHGQGYGSHYGHGHGSHYGHGHGSHYGHGHGGWYRPPVIYYRYPAQVYPPTYPYSYPYQYYPYQYYPYYGRGVGISIGF